MTTVIITSLKLIEQNYPEPWPIIKFLGHRGTTGIPKTLVDWCNSVANNSEWLQFFETTLAAESQKVWSEEQFTQAIDRARTLYIYRVAQFFEDKNKLIRNSECELAVINKFFPTSALKAAVPEITLETKPWIQR